LGVKCTHTFFEMEVLEMKNNGRERISIRLTDEEKKAFKAWCSYHGTTMQDILEDFIKAMLRGDENEKL